MDIPMNYFVTSHYGILHSQCISGAKALAQLALISVLLLSLTMGFISIFS
jgi:hypothetical protein